MAECFAHSYWNLLSDIIHAKIVLLTRKRGVLGYDANTSWYLYCGYKSVFVLEWIENNMVVRSKQD